MAFESHRKSQQKQRNYRTTGRRSVGVRYPGEQQPIPQLQRWLACALIMAVVATLNFLPFAWASTCKTYLAYCFQPGAAVDTQWATWVDWQTDKIDIVSVWQRLTGSNKIEDHVFAYPCEGRIIYPYAWRHHPVTGQVEMHYGIDILVDEGVSVKAAATGTVREIAEEQNLGLFVTIDHGNGTVTRYAHLQEAHVAVGAQVSKGQPIGIIGKTGLTNDTHLHFEVIIDGKPIDPLLKLPR